MTIIGARPQIIKAAAISRSIREKFSSFIKETIVHTGQHYDENMSGIFFSELNIPKPNYNLNIGSGTHAKQTAAMMEGIENLILKEKPDTMILYGDTNSTLAGSIAASKLNLPVIHIEAGLRSFNKSMPEEINRIVCDRVATLLFVPTQTGMNNLQNEGYNLNNQAPYTKDFPGVFHCGDIMYDNSLYFAEIAEKNSQILSNNNLLKNEFILATIHRDNNTDQADRLLNILDALLEISRDFKIILPIHPRTRNRINEKAFTQIKDQIEKQSNFIITDPVSFLDMIQLEKNCKMIVTDSGGVQKEAFFFQKPCIVLRKETEWVELVSKGTAILADANKDTIITAYKTFNGKTLNYPNVFGNGKAAEFICETIIKNFSK